MTKALQLGVEPGTFRQVDIPALGGTGRGLVDFGAGKVEARTVITGQSGILATSNPNAWVVAMPTATHSADEHRLEQIDLTVGDVVAGVGFTIVACSRFGRLFGSFNVGWSWS